VAVLATIGDHIPEPIRLKKTVGRLAPICRCTATCWCARTRGIHRRSSASAPTTVVSGFAGALDDKASTEQLEHVATLIPDEWLAPSATGSPAQCVRAIREQLAIGADGVILHGASPADLAPVVEEYPGPVDSVRM